MDKVQVFVESWLKASPTTDGYVSFEDLRKEYQKVFSQTGKDESHNGKETST